MSYLTRDCIKQQKLTNKSFSTIFMHAFYSTA